MNYIEQYIPIFPLNTVLFSGTSIEINIFEDRYKKLYEEVMKNNRYLGIFCIQEGFEAYAELPIPYEFGTLAKVYHSQNIFFSDSDFHILIDVIGIKKIKLLYYYESSEHFYYGNILTIDDNTQVENITDKEKETFLKEAKMYLDSQNIELSHNLNKDNLILLCHLTLKYLKIPLSEKQKLWEYFSFEKRWKETLKILKQKNLIIKSIQNQISVHDKNLN